MTKTGKVVIEFNYTDAVRKAITGDQLEKAVKAGAIVIQNYAKINVNKTFSKKATGASGLQGSIICTYDKISDTEVTADIGPTKIYGRIQELGGVILPVVAKMLAWMGDTGEMIFAKKVILPARPYLRPAVDENQAEIKAAMAYQLETQIKAVL